MLFNIYLFNIQLGIIIFLSLKYVSEMKSALKRSNELFMEKVSTEEEKQAIACRGMKLKTITLINGSLINYK